MQISDIYNRKQKLLTLNSLSPATSTVLVCQVWLIESVILHCKLTISFRLSQLIPCSFQGSDLENCTVSAAIDEMKMLTYNAKSHFLLVR